MEHTYDTIEIRMTARKLRAAAAEVKELSERGLRQMIAETQGRVEGEAADAMREQLDMAAADIKKISEGLNSIHLELMDFARRLDIADKALAQKIGK